MPQIYSKALFHFKVAKIGLKALFHFKVAKILLPSVIFHICSVKIKKLNLNEAKEKKNGHKIQLLLGSSRLILSINERA